MKRLLIIFLLAFLTQYTFAQYPIKQGLGSDSTLIIPNGAIKGRFIVFPYTDTTQANSEEIAKYPGSLIRIGNDIWHRNSTATKWLKGAIGDIDVLQNTIDSSSFGIKKLDGTVKNVVIYADGLTSGSSGGIQSIQAGTGVTVDNTDPLNPIVSASGGSSYTLPTASSTILGGVKVGSGLSIDGSGVLSAPIYTKGNGLSLTGNTFSLGGSSYPGVQLTNDVYFSTNNNIFRWLGTLSSSSFIIANDNFGGSYGTIGVSLGDYSFAQTNFHTTLGDNINGHAVIGLTGTKDTTMLGVNMTGKTRRGIATDTSGHVKLYSYGSGTFTGTPTYNLGIDATGNIIEVATDGGGGTYTASNGLTMSGSDVQLGGTLTANTTLSTNGFNLNIIGGSGTNAINVSTTAVNGAAVYADGGSGSAGVQAFSSGTVPLQSYKFNSSDIVSPALALFGQRAGIISGGVGLGLSLDMISSTTGGVVSNRLISTVVNATSGSRTSQFDITGTYNSSEITYLTLKGAGNAQFYGAVQLMGYTVATLPTGVQGMTAYVIDATAPTSLSTVVGGGSVVVKVFYNGTNWIVQ